jgi:hypothetical protein
MFTSVQSVVADIVVREIRRELAATPSRSDTVDDRLDPSLYGQATATTQEDVDSGGETWAAAVRRAQAESKRVRRRGNRPPLPALMWVLLDEVIVPRRDDGSVDRHGDGTGLSRV